MVNDQVWTLPAVVNHFLSHRAAIIGQVTDVRTMLAGASDG